MNRIHIHVGVEDLSQSIRFYSSLFGDEPTVLKEDYAKWMLDDPRVNFAISQGHTNGVGIEHLGIQTENDQDLDLIRERLADAEGETFDEEETSCCYARSNKTWAKDPQGVIWETFHTMAEVQHYGESKASQALAASEQASDCCEPT